MLVHIYLLICISCHCKHDCAFIIFIFVLFCSVLFFLISKRSLLLFSKLNMNESLKLVIIGIILHQGHGYLIFDSDQRKSFIELHLKLKLMFVWWYNLCGCWNMLCAFFLKSIKPNSFFYIHIVHLNLIWILQKHFNRIAEETLNFKLNFQFYFFFLLFVENSSIFYGKRRFVSQVSYISTKEANDA